MLDNSQFRPKKKESIKIRLKKYFTEKPKSDFWFWAFITLFVFRWVTPTVLLMMIPLQVGLLVPDSNINYTNISMNVANNIVKPMETMGNLGKNISNNNYTLGYSILTILSYVVYVIWIAMIYLILNLLRYGISYFYRKFYLKSVTTNNSK